MDASEGLVARVRRRLARMADPGNPSSKGEKPRLEFYPQEPSCQIPGLSHLFELFVGRLNNGVFVEVGAYDGRSFSNTWGLAERGWRGVMAEPVPAYATQARQAHLGHPNVRVVQTAVGAEEGSLTVVASGPLTSANPVLNREYEDISWAKHLVGQESLSVPMTTLTKLLESHIPGSEVDVLVVDVEGFERDVFTGFDWAHQPKMLVVELCETHPDLRTTRASDARLMKEIADRGYEIAYKDSINTVFVRRDVWEAALLGLA